MVYSFVFFNLFEVGIVVFRVRGFVCRGLGLECGAYTSNNSLMYFSSLATELYTMNSEAYAACKMHEFKITCRSTSALICNKGNLGM